MGGKIGREDQSVKECSNICTTDRCSVNDQSASIYAFHGRVQSSPESKIVTHRGTSATSSKLHSTNDLCNSDEKPREFLKSFCWYKPF